MFLKDFPEDVVLCMIGKLHVMDKLSLAATCCEARLLLSPLFKEWDDELGEVVCKRMNSFYVNSGFRMKRMEDSRGTYFEMVSCLTSSKVFDICEVTVKNIVYNVFESFCVTTQSGKKVRGWTRIPFFLKEECEFGDVESLCFFPKCDLEWEVHNCTTLNGKFPQPDSRVLEGESVDCFCAVDVSAKVIFDNPRVEMKIKGWASVGGVDRVRRRDGSVHLCNLRYRVKEPTMTESMKGRGVGEAA